MTEITSMYNHPEIRRVALLTAGGLAPCLSSAVGYLIERYTEIAPHIELIAYRGGYRGLLLGDSFVIGRVERDAAKLLHERGGSPLGNSRVKLANVKDCVRRGLVKEGEDPRRVAAERLVKDRVNVLHTIGGDDTNTAAADLAAYLKKNNYQLTVIGLPKTIDNDVVPIVQSLGAFTAAAEGAKFFRNVVADNSSSHRMVTVHEVMGRDCGWLTAATAYAYRTNLFKEDFAPPHCTVGGIRVPTPTSGLGNHYGALDVHAVYVPELEIDLDVECRRLMEVMDKLDCVNIFIAEGAGAKAIAKELRSQGKEVPVDAFGHLKLDSVNVGKWFGEQFEKRLNAGKLIVHKSGYFSRAARSNPKDLVLIKSCCDHAVRCALTGQAGVIGHDEERSGQLRAIEFERIAGGKPFNHEVDWFCEMLTAIGQQKGAVSQADHHEKAQPKIPSKL